MTRALTTLLLFCLLSISLDARIEANFSVPSNVYTLENLDEAVTEAAIQQKPISYLYCDPESTCGLHNNDAELALKETKRFSIVVLLNSEQKINFYNQVSPLVITALKSDEMGNIIPKLVTASADGTQVYALMANKKMDQRSAFRDYRKQVDEQGSWRMGGTESNPILKWYLNNKKGSHYKATFIALEGDNLKLKNMESGNEFVMNIHKFTPGVVAYAQALYKKNRSNTAVPHALETWISADGRELQARFIDLNGNDLTLELVSGKKVTFKLERLSQSSLEHARELSTQTPAN